MMQVFYFYDLGGLGGGIDLHFSTKAAILDSLAFCSLSSLNRAFIVPESISSSKSSIWPINLAFGFLYGIVFSYGDSP
jgi:hypothetical protein